MSRKRIVLQLWEFVRYRRKPWLIPIVLLLMLFGILLVAVQNSSFAWLLYPLF